jgi:outer membrane protein OmpA-like peptidoglycan-associated protein
MKKILSTILTVVLAVPFITACVTPPAENPNVGPFLTVTIPDLFSPDPDIPNDKLAIAIAVEHPVRIKDWQIQIQPNRRGTGQNAQGQAAEGGQRAERPQAAEGTPRPEGQAGERQRNRAPFFEQTGTGTPPKTWLWDGKSTREGGEMVQSATEYLFTLSVNDIFDNVGTFEGIIDVDVLVRREGDILRIIVPSIIFPPNSANFALLSAEDTRANARVLRLIARALNKFDEYQITVEGHANPTTAPGTPARATEETGSRTVIGLVPLSEDRAKAVISFLVSTHSISQTRLSAIGIGGERTVAEWDDDDENWKNRRVEFILKK